MNPKTISTLFLPHGVVMLHRFYRRTLGGHSLNSYLRSVRLARQNKKFHDKYKGKRCFILANGPSTKTLDIERLSNEIVFTVSRGYQHNDYHKLRPLFHVIQPMNSNSWDKKDSVDYLSKMHDGLHDDVEIFANYTEEQLINEMNLFPGRNLNYIFPDGTFGKFPKGLENIPNISGMIPGYQSIVILVLMIAMYMGFNRIFLIGTDHDSFIKGERRYAFESDIAENPTDPSMGLGYAIADPLRFQLRDNASTYAQYHTVHNIAKNNGIDIYNASFGGVLDEFKRISLQEVLGRD